MGNKLREMLNEEIENTATLHFNNINESDSERFIKAINATKIDGKAHSVPLCADIDIYANTNNYCYPLAKNLKINNIEVKSKPEIINMYVEVNEEKQIMPFEGSRNSDTEIILKNVNNNIIDIEIIVQVKENNICMTGIEVKYNTKFENANTMDELILECKKFVALIEMLTNEEKENKSVELELNYFKDATIHFEIIRDLAKVLEIQAEPRIAVADENVDLYMEKLYLLLVKNRIIKITEKCHSISATNIKSFKIGQRFNASFIDKEEFLFLGEMKALYKVHLIIGAIIESIDETREGKKIIYLTDDKIEPMFGAYAGFLTEEEARHQMETIIRNKDMYINAKLFNEQVDELYQKNI